MAAQLTLARITMQPGAERVTGEIEILASDGKVGIVWDTTIADRQDPECRSEGIIEASPDNWQTVLTHARMVTHGSPTRTTFTVPPYWVVPAPPAGWKIRARLRALGPAAITCGLLVRSVTGIRRIPVEPDTHHSVTRDTGNEGYGAAGATVQVALTITSEANRCLIAGTCDDNNNDLSSVSGAGATWSALGAVQNSRDLRQWRGVNPTSGAQTITATWDSTDNDEQVLGVVSFYGVDVSGTPTSDTTTNTGSDSAITVTVPNVVTGDYVIDNAFSFALDTTAPYGVGGGQSVEWLYNDVNAKSAGSIQPGASGGVMSWTLTEENTWATIATRVRQAAAGESASVSPSVSPSASPSLSPSASESPSVSPSASPSVSPSVSPSASESPSVSPSESPSLSPSASESPSASPSESPSLSPSASESPSASPSASPSLSPSASESPSVSPSASPSLSPSASESPSVSPSESPSLSPSASESPSVSPSASPSVSPSLSPSSSPSPSVAPLDGVCWGEQNPDPGEEPVTWQRWQIAPDTGITVQNDPDWGQAEVEEGVPIFSPVTDTGDTDSKTFTITRDKYGLLGEGAVTISIRGAAASFLMHDVSPDWTTYTVPVTQTWRHVQVKLEQA